MTSLAHARLDRGELAGSVGDLGTFLPLLLGMAAHNGLDFGSALFFAGLLNILTGLTFSIPMAVQPMKAIAAVALTSGLTAAQILAAGISVSLAVLLLGLSGLIGWLDRAVPRSVVRGIQLALGLSLLIKGLQMVAGTGLAVGPDSYLTGVLAALLVLLLYRSRRLPAALLLFVAGLGIALWNSPGVLGSLELGLSLPRWSPPALADFLAALPRATLPQIPLTTLNSVIAVCALSRDLFPDRPASPRRVAVSVGLMNLTTAWFGGMPMCHGAGGLAGQYRFGARTNGAVLFLGVTKLALALFLGASLMGLCRAFPASILGVMLGFSGLELALVARDQRSRGDASVMLLTAAGSLALGNVGLGFLIGMALALGLRRGLIRVEDEPPLAPPSR